MPVVLAALMVFHRAVPGGSLLETFLPWLGLAIPFLLVVAVFRTLRSLLAVLLPLVIWLAMFGPRILPAPDDAPYRLVAVQHNVSDENPDPAGTVRTLISAAPDFVGLEEVTPEALPAYVAAFGDRYPYFTVQGTVGLWSRHPLTSARLLDIRPASLGPDWNRGLRAVASTPHGDVAVYVVHLPSVRLNALDLESTRRDESARKLTAALAAEPLERVVLLGDLNSTVDDRVLHPILERLGTSVSGFAFSWPAATPLARIDHVLAAGMTVTSVRTLPRTGSDHLPIIARLAS